MAASTSLTPEQRVLRSRMAAYAQHSQGRTNTAPATAAAMARFERQVDPDGQLAPAERARRAEHARRAFYSGLAYASSKSRAQRKAERLEAFERASLEQAHHAALAEADQILGKAGS